MAPDQVAAKTLAAGPAPRYFTWDEVAQRSGREERWLVIERKVYNISEFIRLHPGGSRVISHYAGQDATDPFVAFHINKGLVRKYMNSLLIGELSPEQPSFEPTKNKELTNEFRELRTSVERMGLMKANHVFFLLYLLHILLMDVAAWLTLWLFGTSFVPFLLCAVLLSAVQLFLPRFLSPPKLHVQILPQSKHAKNQDCGFSGKLHSLPTTDIARHADDSRTLIPGCFRTHLPSLLPL